VSSACGAGDAVGVAMLVHISSTAGRSGGVGADAERAALPNSASAEAFLVDGKLPLVFARGGAATAGSGKCHFHL
jgi:hypothetical protein